MRLLLTLLAVVAISNIQLRTTEATAIPYGNYAGSTVSFNGVSENPSFNPTPTTGLYGAPTVMGNMLIFAPLAFEASVSGVGSANVSSTLSAIVAAQPGFLINSIELSHFFGDYGLTVPFAQNGTASAGAVTSVNLDGPQIFGASISATSNTPPGFSAPFSFSPSMSAISPTASVNLSALTTLTASTTSVFNDAFIKAKGFKVTFTTVPDTGVIPEPTSALIFMGLGLVGLTSRRRR
jgi:PEP-CTERM motif